MLDWYVPIAVVIFVVSLLFTAMLMSDYNSEKNRSRPNSRVVEKNRHDVRIAFVCLLLSPVWPAILALVLINGFIKTARVVMEVD